MKWAQEQTRGRERSIGCEEKAACALMSSAPVSSLADYRAPHEKARGVVTKNQSWCCQCMCSKFLEHYARLEEGLIPRAYILLRRRGHATPIVTVQTSKFFSVTKNSNIATVRTRACQYCL